MLSPLFGPYGSGALAKADQLSAYGVNAVWFHGFDPAAFEACSRHGLHACVELKTFRADFGRHPELIPIGVDGRPIRCGELVQGVCLSQASFLAEIEADLEAGLRTFAPAGIWLDYLTYAGWFETPDPDLQESCFCDACVADFCNATGLDADRPVQILAHHAAAWMQRKCERVAAAADRYAGLIRQHRTGCIVGAYMCPWRPDEHDGALRRIFAQDYTLLAPSIDVFTPLIYAAKSGRPPDWGAEFLQRAAEFVPDSRQVQLILDVLDFPDSLLAVAQAKPPSWGVQIFGGARVFANPATAAIFAQAVQTMQQRGW